MSTEHRTQSSAIVYPITCNLCNKQDNELLYRVQGRNLVKCRTCGLIFVNPWVEEPALYAEDYFQERNKYIERQAEFRRIFDRLLKQIGKHASGGLLLDVGCGPGLLLDVARKYGWEPMGIEISEWAANYAREELGLPVIQGMLEGANYPPKHFDAIIFNHVLEHVPDPTNILNVARQLLRDDGLLVVGVPNMNSLEARLKKERWGSLLVDQHRWHFTPQTLSKLLAKAGFRVEQITTESQEPQGGIARWTKLAIWSLMASISNSGAAMVAFAHKAS